MNEKNSFISFFVLLILAVLLFVGCLPGEKQDKNIKLEKTGEFHLPLPKNFPPKSLAQKHFSDGQQEYLFWQSKTKDGLLLYNITKERVEKEIHFLDEGPGSIPNAALGFSVLSFDSIYICGYVPGKLFRIDTSGILQDYLVFADTSSENRNINDLSILNAKVQSDLYKMNDKIVVPLRFPYFPEFPGETMIKQIPLFSIYSSARFIAENSTISIPVAIYQNGDPLPRAMTNTCANGQVYFAFQCDPNVFTTKDFANYQIYPLPSVYAEAFTPLNTGEHPHVRTAKSFFYSRLLWDQYNRIFYRFVKLPVYDSLTDYETENSYPSRFSIIVADENMNKLGEVLFQNENYSMTNCFVSSRGLCMLRTPFHEGYSEDHLTFDVYKFE